MRTWEMPDAEQRLSEVAELALKSGPQRITGSERGAVVVLDAAEYRRLTEREPAGARTSIRGFGGKELFDIMQNSPLAQGIRDGDIPEDWLERSREASRHCECCARRQQDRNVDAADSSPYALDDVNS
jgi:prevent-host-death family protein